MLGRDLALAESEGTLARAFGWGLGGSSCGKRPISSSRYALMRPGFIFLPRRGRRSGRRGHSPGRMPGTLMLLNWERERAIRTRSGTGEGCSHTGRPPDAHNERAHCTSDGWVIERISAASERFLSRRGKHASSTSYTSTTRRSARARASRTACMHTDALIMITR